MLLESRLLPTSATCLSMQKDDILRQFRAYERAAASIRQEMLAVGSRRTLAAGTTIFHGGDAVQQFALVGSGHIRVFKSGRTGREITLYHVGPGEVCLQTVASILGRRAYPAMAVVEDPVEAVVYPAAQLRHWVEVSPAVREMVFGLFTSRLAHVMALIDEIVFRRLDARLAEFLELRLRPRGDHLTVLKITHEEIAAELGSAREVVSRLLKEFERRGAIELGRGRITLVDGRSLTA